MISWCWKLQKDLGHSQLWIWKPFQWVKPCSFQTDTIDILCWFPNDFLSCWYRFSPSPTAVMNGDDGCLMAHWEKTFPVVFLLIHTPWMHRMAANYQLRHHFLCRCEGTYIFTIVITVLSWHHLRMLLNELCSAGFEVWPQTYWFH